MATCNKCIYWELSNDEVNGVCANDKALNRLLYGPTYHCFLFEQKGTSMGTCKECRRFFDGTYCELLYLGNIDGVLRRRKIPEVDCNDSLMPQEDFGCVHFEQKSRGPFEVKFRESVLGINFGDDGDWLCVDEIESAIARRICSWLNEHWSHS